LNLGKNLLLSSSKTHLLSLHFFFSPYLMFVYRTNVYCGWRRISVAESR